jgi:glycosyltransferase involved in cell wall biosynthesis
MNILVNALSARRGGGQTYIKKLLSNLEYDSIRIYLLAPDSLTLNDCPKNVIRLAIKWPTNPFLRILWEIFFMPGLIKKNKVDVVFWPGGLISCFMPANCTTVMTFQNMMPFSTNLRAEFPLGYMRVRHWLLEKGMVTSMKRSDLVIFLSNFAKDLITCRIGHNLKSSLVIPHGISKEFNVTDAIPRLDWLPAGEYFLYISDFYEYKNQIEVVRAYALLKQERKTREKLLLVGFDNTNYGKKVKLEILRLGMEDDIIITGFRQYEELPTINHYAKIVIFASECENCPNILLEAMSCGKPLIVANCQPMPEFGGDAVIYFDPASPQDLADKIRGIVDQPDRLQELGKKARLLSLQYNWQITAQKTWAAITDVGNMEKFKV